MGGWKGKSGTPAEKNGKRTDGASGNERGGIPLAAIPDGLMECGLGV